MENLILCAKALKVAQLYRAKNDLRYWLNGVYIDTHGVIYATNGAVVVRCTPDQLSPPKSEIIIDFNGIVPAKARTAELVAIESGGVFGVILFKDWMQKVISSAPYEIVDGVWPKKITDELFEKQPSASKSVFLNPSYFHLIEKTSKALGAKHPSVEIVFNKKSKMINCRFIDRGFGQVEALIMEMNEGGRK